LDADPRFSIAGRVSQLITGLTPGKAVMVTFSWAAAQAFGGITTTETTGGVVSTINGQFFGASNEQLLVGLCSTAGSGGATVGGGSPGNPGPTPAGCGTIPAAPSTGNPPPALPHGSNSNTGNSGNLQTTDTVATPSHGFSPWKTETFTFFPTNGSVVLSFLARGTPQDVPPMVLLDGILLREEGFVPEPDTWLLMGIGFAAMAGIVYLRRKWVFVPDDE
jgi:hypothetical protein